MYSDKQYLISSDMESYLNIAGRKKYKLQNNEQHIFTRVEALYL